MTYKLLIMPNINEQKLDYRAAGVDIDAGNRLVDGIKPLAKATAKPWAMASLGGFGGIVDLAKTGIDDPLLLLATDGVGTKLKLAIDYDHHETIGIDLVAMCVNDLVVQGAKPLAFLDYYACGTLDEQRAKTIIAGIAEGCKIADAVLVGGESAEMPGMYQGGHYDLAGFAMGAVSRQHLLSPDLIQAGDRLIGLPSSGAHSNGYSLIRKVLDRAQINPETYFPEFAPNASLLSLLLAPTRIYVAPILALLAEARDAIHGISHITGGGFFDNIPRILNDSMQARIDDKAWQWPPLFDWLQATGQIDRDEMLRSFNCGIGMVLAVDKAQVPSVMNSLKALGETPIEIGEIVERPPNQDKILI